MPFRLIFTIILVVLVAVVTGFNLDNKCNIWLFHTFQDVPVIFTMLTSFVLGVLVTLPSVFMSKSRKDSDRKSSESKNTAKTSKKNAKAVTVAEEKKPEAGNGDTAST